MNEALLPRDPAMLGGHRLLARLGAGGMGVVYLGRASTGGLAAVKAVHPELADDPDFRARFRREAEAARRVNSPWVTPVTAAGPEDPTPWLATAFVPGPSLGEAVRRFGPLPTRSVRHLGRMLAAALREVHAAGLVHRDVKPGNVLLAVDGPRLIDFGIARSAEHTVLTAPGVVAGTPGFLSPEQADARAAGLGSPSDVFSLGCVLAYAATGRPPFGTGTAEAMLYRTVHDEPDLTGLSADGEDHDGEHHDGGSGETLLMLLRDCLAKDPAARPTAGRAESRLSAAPLPDGGWLPESVVRHIADRSAQMLALPDIEPTTPDTPAGDAPARPGRRRIIALASSAAVLAAAGGGTLWAVSRDGGTEPSDDGTGWSLGVHADLTGPAGRAQEQGTRLAVEQYNSRRDKPFALGLRTLDDRGSAARSKAAAKTLADDHRVLAVLGPTSEATAEAAVTAYDTALLPVLFVVPGGMMLLNSPSRSALHCRARNADLAFRIVVHLAKKAHVSRTGLLLDRTSGSYGWVISAMTSDTLRQAGIPLYPRVVPRGVRDVRPPVADIVRADVDSFVYAGFAEGGADVARHLADTGFGGPRMGAQELIDPAFTEGAGAASEGWLLTASFVDPSAVPAAESFTTAFRRRFGAEPGYFAAEAYDAANLTIREMTKAVEGGRPPSRKRLTSLLRRSSYRGITKSYSFHRSNGTFADEGVFMYRVEDGGFHYRGPAPKGA